MNELMNNEGVCRKAPATPGLLNTLESSVVWWAVMSWGWACEDTSSCRMSTIGEASLLHCFDAKKVILQNCFALLKSCLGWKSDQSQGTEPVNPCGSRNYQINQD